MVKTTKDWALPTLEKYGFRYDSSVFPVGFHPDYGIADAPLTPYKITDQLYEFPMSVLEMYGRRFPFCGGGYFRLFPYAYTRFCMRKVNEQGRSVGLLPASVGTRSRTAPDKKLVRFAEVSPLSQFRSDGKQVETPGQ